MTDQDKVNNIAKLERSETKFNIISNIELCEEEPVKALK